MDKMTSKRPKCKKTLILNFLNLFRCYRLPVNLIINATLQQELLVVDTKEGVPVYTLVQHLIRVDRVLLA